MSQKRADIEEIEISIEEAKKVVARANDIRILTENPLFKKIIMDGYFVQEAARLAHLSSDPSIDEKIRGYVIRDLAGPGALKRFIQAQISMGNAARSELAMSEEALDELRSEEAAE